MVSMVAEGLGSVIVTPTDSSNRLMNALQKCSGRPIHRLDRDTSGLLLVALEPQVHRLLSLMFQHRQIQKTYEAVCTGELSGDAGFLASPQAKYQDRPPLYRSHPEGKMALTGWQRLETANGRCRLRLAPLTGRSHQLRVHLSELGHPIVGDPLYNPKINSGERLMLHAQGLKFICPLALCPIELQSPTPF